MGFLDEIYEQSMSELFTPQNAPMQDTVGMMDRPISGQRPGAVPQELGGMPSQAPEKLPQMEAPITAPREEMLPMPDMQQPVATPKMEMPRVTSQEQRAVKDDSVSAAKEAIRGGVGAPPDREKLKLMTTEIIKEFVAKNKRRPTKEEIKAELTKRGVLNI